ncbi:hypothetical protein ROLI_030100 [Roseobacter fucihabitans]|uniref:Transposase n=1 Tax=Roseobacter fucihabitans TaxID=1537242 RepID=A0ABZ2BXM1_9RHOB|nr:IS66 Orf2 like protein [Roseobacter litoralis]
MWSFVLRRTRQPCALPRLWLRCDPSVAWSSDICGDEARRLSQGTRWFGALVQSHLQKKPFDGAVYVFRAKRADRLKMIWWGGTGLVMAYKRLEQNAFKWPAIRDGVLPRGRADEERLVADMIELTRQFGRYVYRRITTQNDHIMLWATAHLRQRPSFRWTKRQSCNNFQTGPPKWDCSGRPALHQTHQIANRQFRRDRHEHVDVVT